MTAPCAVASFDAFYRSENRRLLRFFGKRVGWEAAPDLAIKPLRVYQKSVLWLPNRSKPT